MRILIITLLTFSFMNAVAQNKEKEFLNNLNKFCNQSFSGEAVFPEGDRNPFAGKALKIYFSTCTEKEVRIPFHVGEDKSRTWVLTIDEKGLLLKHDHRHEDGTPDEITMYGGYANAKGNGVEQFFPADEYTANLIPAAATNEWTFALSEDKKTLSYMLKRDEQLRFHARFDLTKPLEK
ncbi:MAG: hypothetical protein KF845_00600 [Cyclobacteriaceae bacterium]|nr:hypothetical protein [Cyclobacteriaceae bacterium]